MIVPKKISGLPSYNESEITKLSLKKSRLRKIFSTAGYIEYSPVPLESRDVILAKGGISNQVFSVSRVQREDVNDSTTDLCLPFDRTVPGALFVARNEREIIYPFKRYDISYSFRGERPQLGRQLGFLQGDIDIIGDGELGIHNDIDCFSTIYHALVELEFGSFKMHLNNIAFLKGVLIYYSLDDQQHSSILRVVDKLAKEPTDSIKKQLIELSVNPDIAAELIRIFSYRGTIASFKTNFPSVAEFLNEQLTCLKAIIEGMKHFGVPDENLVFNPSIARGLDYYSGAVFETFIDEAPEFGSISSGGRYDNLANHFTKNSHPGVGGSIGLSRLFDYVIKRKLVGNQRSLSQLVVGCNSKELYPLTYQATNLARQQNVRTDMYSGQPVFRKLLSYADRKEIPVALLIQSSEKFVLKNIRSGKQIEFANLLELPAHLKNI